MSLLRVGEMQSRWFENLGLFFNRLELTLVKILDLKVAVSLAVQLRAALRIGLYALEVFQIHSSCVGVKHLPGPTS